MRLILHIGMGKTGTSSIQKALEASHEKLAEQDVHYLGMWLDMLGEPFKGFRGLPALFGTPPEKQQELAQVFVAHMHDIADNEGPETFVFSNEALFQQACRITPFIEVLKRETQLDIIAYMRDPHQWLPSAFAQWGIRHKTEAGPLQPFPEAGRSLIRQYESMADWIERFCENLVVRRHDKSLDVVKDFAEFCGFDLVEGNGRFLERSEPAELLMRAAFNSRFKDQVLPERFNNHVFPNGKRVRSLRDLASLCFQYDQLEEIVEEQRPLFEGLARELGPDFDFLGGEGVSRDQPDYAQIQQRVIDYLVELSLDQALRIERLESRIATLEKAQ